ncbi:uncharacterized protein [Ptychodera flava]|uniref:uncharacterized protein n=1 Tax=Ptychodera flava TaxID=63121 RepID=UPI003969F0EA
MTLKGISVIGVSPQDSTEPQSMSWSLRSPDLRRKMMVVESAMEENSYLGHPDDNRVQYEISSALTSTPKHKVKKEVRFKTPIEDISEKKGELGSSALDSVGVHKKMRLLSLMDSAATVEKLQNPADWDNCMTVCPEAIENKQGKYSEINSNTEFVSYRMPSESPNKNEYDLNIELDSAYHSTCEINDNTLERSSSVESIDSNCADYCLNIASTESFTIDNTRTHFGHGRPSPEDPTKARSIGQIRESLEQKVKRLRQEKAEVDEKIRLAQEEDVIRSQEKVKFQQQLTLHRKERLKRVVGELRKKLEGQSHQLQCSYNNILLLKRNLLRSRSFVRKEALEGNDTKESPF